jgi:hypothetical protein
VKETRRIPEVPGIPHMDAPEPDRSIASAIPEPGQILGVLGEVALNPRGILDVLNSIPAAVASWASWDREAG